MKILFFVLLCVLPAYSFAQKNLPTSKPAKQRNALQPKGYTGGTQLGLFVSRAYYTSPWGSYYYTNTSGMSFQTMQGYRFNPYLALYGVAELNIYDVMYLLPVMVSGKATLRKHGFTPYLVGEAGYALELVNDKKRADNSKSWGGLAFGGEIGLQFPNPQKTAVTFAVGVRNQRMRQEYIENSTFYESRIIARRLHIRLGMTF